jgi:hypothetical protein
LFVVACGDAGFDKPYQVNRMRVLAIGAEPAELAPDGEVLLSALVATVSSTPVTLDWELCLFSLGPNAGYACAEDESGQAAGVTFEAQETLSLDYETVTSLVGTAEELCSQLDEISVPRFVELPECDRGFPITVRLTAGDGNSSEVAVRTLMLLKDGIEPNSNPALGEVLADGALWPPDAPLPSTADEIEVEVEVNLDAADRIAGARPEDAPRREDLSLSWFVTAGELDVARTYYREGTTTDDEIRINTLVFDEAGPDEAATTVRLWMVLRDDRGGVSWTERTLDRQASER